MGGHKTLFFLPARTRLSAWLWLQTAAFPTGKRLLGSAATGKGGAKSELRTALSTPTQYQMFILLCQYSWEMCSPYFSAHHQMHYQGRCQFMHSINCLKLKRAATQYWWGGTVPENMEYMQEALLTHTCLQLGILVHGKPLLAKPHKIPVWHLTYCNSCPHFTCCEVSLLFYLRWHIKTTEKCKNNAKKSTRKWQRWLNNREKKNEKLQNKHFYGVQKSTKYSTYIRRGQICISWSKTGKHYKLWVRFQQTIYDETIKKSMSYFKSLAWENISINTGLNGKQITH